MNEYGNAIVESTGPVALPDNYKPNEEELKLLAQCRRESNLKGGFGALLFGTLAYQSIKTFKLNVSPKYGMLPKVGSACFFGFFVGKLVAIPSCYEKFKQLPNSPVGALLRQRASGRRDGSAMETIPDANLNFAAVNTPNYTDNGRMNSAIDIDVYNSPSNMDSYTGDELNGPDSGTFNDDLPDQKYVDRPAVSYAELRGKHRSEHLKTEKERQQNFANFTANDAPPAQPIRRSTSSTPIEKKNKYGDVWE